ncbi:MAG: MotA/TolQ/ExbB proton channel family protein, partial [Thermoguttaceae bacterium]|nr:MotA/TolQ/ExbB proton channel family protein [Thermoguttaceae bacterium]
LLGTVLGMVAAFGELAASDGLGHFANLAQGIYFALVTTVDGLLVAIPALALYSYFNHRVASFSAEAAELATEMFRPLKRHFLSRGAVPPVRPNGSADQEPAK